MLYRFLSWWIYRSTFWIFALYLLSALSLVKYLLFLFFPCFFHFLSPAFSPFLSRGISLPFFCLISKESYSNYQGMSSFLILFLYLLTKFWQKTKWIIRKCFYISGYLCIEKVFINLWNWVNKLAFSAITVYVLHCYCIILCKPFATQFV